MKRIDIPYLTLIIFYSILSCNPTNNSSITSGNWITRAQLNGPARSEAVCFVIGNFAFIGTGWDGLNNRYTDFWKYDPTSNLWSQVNGMPGSGRSSAIAFSVQGHGYVGTGFDGINILQDFYEFDTAQNNWTRIADYPGGGRYEAVAFGLGNFGYAGTGFDGNNAQKDFYQYDPVKDIWTETGFSGNKRFGAVTFTYNNKAYLVTGVNSGVMQKDFWQFDPSSNGAKWTQLRNISNTSTDAFDDLYTTIVRWNGSAFIAGGHAYISTGDDVSNNNTTWEYTFPDVNGGGDLWNQKTPFEGPPTTGAVGFSLVPVQTGGGGFIATGRTSNGQGSASDYLREFFPGQPENPND